MFLYVILKGACILGRSATDVASFFSKCGFVAAALNQSYLFLCSHICVLLLFTLNVLVDLLSEIAPGRAIY